MKCVRNANTNKIDGFFVALIDLSIFELVEDGVNLKIVTRFNKSEVVVWNRETNDVIWDDNIVHFTYPAEDLEDVK